MRRFHSHCKVWLIFTILEVIPFVSEDFNHTNLWPVWHCFAKRCILFRCIVSSSILSYLQHYCEHNIETNSAAKSDLFNLPHQHIPYPSSNFLSYVRDHVHTYTYILIYACSFKTVHVHNNITNKIKNDAYSKILAVGILASSLLYILLDLKGQF